MLRDEIAYRAVYVDYVDDPVPSRSVRGRFHDERSKGTTSYLAETWETAWSEVRFRWMAQEIGYRKIEVRLRLTKVIDLTEASERAKYGITIEELLADDYQACQQLANKLRADGVEAIRTFSKANQPNGRQWVVFLECLRPDSYVKVSTVSRIEG